MRDRPLSPHLQVYRWPLSMLLSILHRATGVFLTVGTAALVWWLLAVAQGGARFAQFQGFADSLWGKLVFFGWAASWVLHMLNGVRHLAWDAGWGYELGTVRTTGWVVVVGTVLLTAMIWVFARGGFA